MLGAVAFAAKMLSEIFQKNKEEQDDNLEQHELSSEDVVTENLGQIWG